MSGPPDGKAVREQADLTEATFRLRPNVYVIGSLERGVTVHAEQVRAHNLAWALWETRRATGRSLGRVAVVGAGIAGLTFTAGLLSLFSDQGGVDVTLFERRWDLCPLQQGCDTRWLHPNVYSWPRTGSLGPEASLPVLTWSAGRASDVANAVVRRFGDYCASFEAAPNAFRLVLGLRLLQIVAATGEVEWVGSASHRVGSYFHAGRTSGESSMFDTIVLAVGYGLEGSPSEYPAASYWRNEQFGQPNLNGARQTYLVSGYGDGALVDLCRLTVERFRQDAILDELFAGQLADVEAELLDRLGSQPSEANIYGLLGEVEETHLAEPKRRLASRLRKDTLVVLNLRGKSGDVKSFREIFGPRSSVLNRLMTYMLFRCGAFAVAFDPLEETVRQHEVPPRSVLCRHGAAPMEHLRSLFVDPKRIQASLKRMSKARRQDPTPRWVPGSFPPPREG